MTPDIEAALRQERIEIARMLRTEATKHGDAAAELRTDYDHHEVADEVWAHEEAADILNRFADLILARTPTVAVEEAPEIVF